MNLLTDLIEFQSHLLSHSISHFLLVAEIGLISQGENCGNAEKLAGYICSRKWMHIFQ